MTAEKVQIKKTNGSSAAEAVMVQRNLAIGAVNDPLEHEADTMADKVMSMQEVPTPLTSDAGGIQRKCADCEEEEKLQRKPLTSFIQKKESSAGTVASDAVSNKINASKGGGSKMDSHTQSFMQNRFGAEFSDVKIHTNGEAILMNRELNAKAFTAGNDIYFNEGQYNPGSSEGKHLLAHELTHTIQQKSNLISASSGNENHQGTLQRQDGTEPEPVVVPPPICPVTAIAPYGPPDGPAVGNAGMTADTITAMNCLQAAVTAAGGTMSVTTRYRAQAYQDHLVEVWDKVNAPAHPEPECAAVRQNYATERATHFPMGAPARGVSNHTNGTAFDATVTLPAGANLNTIKAGCNLTTPVAGEPWHYET